MTMNLLFVCTGNTCRSPLAEVLARAEAERRGRSVTCISAGTFAFPGQPAAAPGIAVAAERGLDLSRHASRELSLELLEWADLVLGMDRPHVEMVRRSAPDLAVALIGDFLPSVHPAAGGGVPDPFGGDRDTYLATIEHLEAAIAGLFDRLDGEDGDEGPATPDGAGDDTVPETGPGDEPPAT
jgi:protein-tyrosine-phosphatase